MNPLQTVTLAEQRHLELLAEATEYRRTHPGRPARRRPAFLGRLFRVHRPRRIATTP